MVFEVGCGAAGTLFYGWISPRIFVRTHVKHFGVVKCVCCCFLFCLFFGADDDVVGKPPTSTSLA